MTYPEALRAYADWMDKNADLNIQKGSISLYGSDHAAVELVRRGEAEIDTPDSNEIVYVNLPHFAPLKVQFVVKKKALMTPVVKDGEVVWTLKNEFTPLGAF